MLTALIVDDEPLVRADLRRQLEAHGVRVLGDAENALLALQLAEELRPDVVLLDIRMPGLSGIHMASAMLHLDSPPQLIFVTGFTEHAVEAFDLDAVDYLVKPVAPERLARALVRARDRQANRQARRVAGNAVEEKAAAAGPVRLLPVRTEHAIRLLALDEILFAIARAKRVFVRTTDTEYRTYYPLKQLEALLPDDRFVRIHDSYLVNLDVVREILILGDHTYEVRLTNGQRLPVGRSRYAALQRQVGLAGRTPS